MTVCNMAIEAGARAGLVGVDETTIAYLEGRPLSPSGAEWDSGRGLLAHPGQRRRRAFDRVVEIDAAHDRAPGQLGHQPGDGAAHRRLHARASVASRTRCAATPCSARWLHGPAAAPAASAIAPDKVFIGSCTNSRIEDLREAAAVVQRIGGRGRQGHQAGAGRARLRSGQGAGRGRGPGPRLQGLPASSGASPAARCAWR